MLASQVAQNQRLNSLTAYAGPSSRPRKLARPLNAHESDYIDAIDSVADYLESIGADAVWVDRFDELSGALKDLVKGELPALLRPATPKI